MNKKELWSEIIRQNPQFDQPTFPMNKAMVRKLVDLVWTVATKKESAKTNPFEELLRGFNKGRSHE